MENIFYQEGKQAVILFHSITQSPQEMYFLANYLRKSGFTVYAPYLSGHRGNKMIESLKISVNDWFEDGLRALHFMKEAGYDDVCIIGQSLGGVVALDLLNQQLGIKKAVIISTPAFPGWHHAAVEDEVLEKIRQDALSYDTKNVRKEKRAALVKIRRLLSEIDQHSASTLNKYKDIQQEVLIIHASDDQIVPQNMAKRLHIEVDKSVLKIFQTDNHLLSTSRLNETLAHNIVTFLNK